MPKVVNVHETKTHLSSLLERVRAGEEIILAKNGRPYAPLIPLEKPKKRKLGSMKGLGKVDKALNSLQVEELLIARAHALKASAWPMEHRDPFDRILAAQAALEGLPLITTDPAFKEFSIEIIW